MDTIIAGRPVRLTTVRTRVKKGWRFYNAMVIRFLDNNETHTMGAAAFEAWSNKLEREFKNADETRKTKELPAYSTASQQSS
jgi:hypothetical protein